MQPDKKSGTTHTGRGYGWLASCLCASLHCPDHGGGQADDETLLVVPKETLAELLQLSKGCQLPEADISSSLALLVGSCTWGSPAISEGSILNGFPSGDLGQDARVLRLLIHAIEKGARFEYGRPLKPSASGRAAANVDFPGRIVPGAQYFIASFPGKFHQEWKNLTQAIEIPPLAFSSRMSPTSMACIALTTVMVLSVAFVMPSMGKSNHGAVLGSSFGSRPDSRCGLLQRAPLDVRQKHLQRALPPWPF
ncbi:unnamed protein product [Symbiodinium natans]|uniref:Uncharacterized protein n=1 Tax=Symbiodinium natans TaxID=878477 RepID=A0A812R338_9DINO|nr:unnamed protein product [Symbiodinium natans]